jgi:hypothetical protein
MVSGYFPSVTKDSQTRNERLRQDSAPGDAEDEDSAVVGRRTVLKLATASSLPIAGLGVEKAAASGSSDAIATVGYGAEGYGAYGYSGTN